jgi:hypothetical protein
MNKKFEIKKNKEINIDIYYNNMTNIDNIINLSLNEFKDFIEKGNTLEQNDISLNIISKEIENCEKIINELNNKIIEFTIEKDDKWKKWSYLYELYRNMIGNSENKKDSNSPTECVDVEKDKKIIKKKDKNNVLEEKQDNILLEPVNDVIIDNNEKTVLSSVLEKKNKKVLKKKEQNDIVDDKDVKEPIIKVKKNTKKKVLNNTDDDIKSNISNNDLINKKDVKE